MKSNNLFILFKGRQKHPPREESLSVQYKLTENSEKIENYINRIEIGSKKLNSDKNFKAINSYCIRKDVPIHDILTMSYINNKHKNDNNIKRNDHEYMQNSQFSNKKSNINLRNTKPEKKFSINNNDNCYQYNEEEDNQIDVNRNKYASFINFDKNVNIIQKYKKVHNIIYEEEKEKENQEHKEGEIIEDEEEEEEERKEKKEEKEADEEKENKEELLKLHLSSKQKKLNEDKEYYFSQIKNYEQGKNYDLSSNQDIHVVDSLENDINNYYYNELKIHNKTSSSDKNHPLKYVEGDIEKNNKNEKVECTNNFQKNYENEIKDEALTKERQRQNQQQPQEKKIEYNGTIDNEMPCINNGNKTITIYKDMNNSESNVKNVEKVKEKSKSSHKKSLSSEKSFKEKLRRYERKQIKKEIEASEERSVIFDDIKYFRKHHDLFNIKKIIDKTDYLSDNNHLCNKNTINKDTIYIIEDGREVLGFESTNGKTTIISGTVEKLLLRLVDESTYDEEYIDAFLQYHQFFISSVDLMHNLIARFNIQLESKEDADELTFNEWSKQIQLKVIHVLNHWISIQHSCFIKNTLVHALLEYFISAIWSSGYKNEADRLKRNITNIVNFYIYINIIYLLKDSVFILIIVI